MRDRIIAMGNVHWIDYQLDYRDGAPKRDFASYSLEYRQFDRIVPHASEPGYVLEVTDGSPPVLRVGDWPALAAKLRT